MTQLLCLCRACISLHKLLLISLVVYLPACCCDLIKLILHCVFLLHLITIERLIAQESTERVVILWHFSEIQSNLITLIDAIVLFVSQLQDLAFNLELCLTGIENLLGLLLNLAVGADQAPL